ncbi:hypothetical protein SAMN02800687_1929 [Curtobacterium sp. UNCCL20]|uniref:hypothetical protein n=1 Tax=Curtobacterium sp. UNCCL20 TaxID=1502773 RepID=UPI00088AB005|nr:hypothetical protein [Curtobacterium sp. UNCCL20]SDQ57322.1 hypothetical protein SAMN02800687_1929 [Curtobacterium sp. UNCCL20]
MTDVSQEAEPDDSENESEADSGSVAGAEAIDAVQKSTAALTAAVTATTVPNLQQVSITQTMRSIQSAILAMQPYAAQAAVWREQMVEQLAPALQIIRDAAPAAQAIAQMNRSAAQAIAPALESVRQFDLNYGEELQRTIRLMQPAISAYAVQHQTLRQLRFDSIVKPSLDVAVAGYQGRSATRLDGLGTMYAPVAKSPSLLQATENLADALATTGPLGVDYARVRAAADDFKAAYDAAPEPVRSELEASLPAAQDQLGVSDELVDRTLSFAGLRSYLELWAGAARTPLAVGAGVAAGAGWVLTTLGSPGEGILVGVDTFRSVRTYLSRFDRDDEPE